MENINVVLGILRNTLFRQWWCNQSSMFSNATISYHSIESLQFSFSGCLLFRVPGVILTSWNLQQRRRCRSLVPKKFVDVRKEPEEAMTYWTKKFIANFPVPIAMAQIIDGKNWTILWDEHYCQKCDTFHLVMLIRDFQAAQKKLHHMCDIICVFSGSTSLQYGS